MYVPENFYVHFCDQTLETAPCLHSGFSRSKVTIVSLISECWVKTKLLYLHSYLVFNLVYFALGGRRQDGQHYIYPVLDWSHPGTALMWAAVALIGIVLIHVIVYGMYR